MSSTDQLEPMAPQHEEAAAVGGPRPVPGIYWVLGIFVGATATYLMSRGVYNALNIGGSKPTSSLFSIGTSTLGAAIATAFALAAYKPFDRISSNPVRGSIIMGVSLLLVFGFWTILSGPAGISMPRFAFPIIGTTWFLIAATSFIGEDAHVANLPPGRRTLLNLLIWVAGTALIVASITWIPPFWFGFIQTLLVTGGFAYILHGVKQPTKSFFAWSILAILTAAAIIVSSALNTWVIHAPRFGPWPIGGPSAEWGIFFGLWCGLNYGVLAPMQCWPFSRIRQPWGTVVATLSVILWCYLLTLALEGIFGAIFSNRAIALVEAQDWAWNTVFWGFCFALVLGAGSRPYLWRGQTTPGSWEDLDAQPAKSAAWEEEVKSA
jgi:hypothetical protein